MFSYVLSSPSSMSLIGLGLFAAFHLVDRLGLLLIMLVIERTTLLLSSSWLILVSNSLVVAHIFARL